MSQERKGELYLFGSTFFWAFFPIVTKIAFGQVSLFVLIAWTTGFSCLFFFCICVAKKKLNQLKQPILWRYLILVALFTGVLFYVFYFTGLSLSSPGNVSILGLFEVFTSFILFNILRKEKFIFEYKIGALCMVIGAAVVLFKNFSSINIGDALIILATCIAPFGNLFQQKARMIASSEIILFVRTLVATPILFLLAHIFSGSVYTTDLLPSFPVLILIGFVFLGISKLFWVESIHRISVTKASALSSVGPFLTLLFAWLLLKQVPTLWQLAALPLFILGVLFLTNTISFKKRKNMAHYEIREITDENIDSIIPLLKEAEGETHIVEKMVSNWKSGENTFSKPGEKAWGLFVEGECIAFGGIVIDPYLEENEGSVGRVRHVYVAKSYRGQGLSKVLMASILKHAKKYFSTVRLGTGNPIAKHVYESLGFTETGESTPSGKPVYSLTF